KSGLTRRYVVELRLYFGRRDCAGGCYFAHRNSFGRAKHSTTCGGSAERSRRNRKRDEADLEHRRRERGCKWDCNYGEINRIANKGNRRRTGARVMDPTTRQLWIVSLIAAIVVVLVVAVVLELIVRTAHQINELVQQIWYGGTRIAQNTVTLALLRETNNLAGKILGSASEVSKTASRIRQKTSSRP